jgi:hypothetical protein
MSLEILCKWTALDSFVFLKLSSQKRWYSKSAEDMDRRHLKNY